MDYVLLALLAVNLVVLLVLLLRKQTALTERDIEDAARRVISETALQQSQELAASADRLRDSLTAQINDSRDANRRSLTEYAQSTAESLDRIRDRVDERLETLRKSLETGVADMRASNEKKLEDVRRTVDERLETLRKSLETGVADMRASNEKKLEEMRRTVDEKLEKTLESRLQKSFETVSTQLESVNKGLGEMRTVAESVGSLNKVLSNVKTRGILGELQLGQIIMDILPPHLYETEFVTKPGTNNRVEYAIKMPGSGASGNLYLPIDSKFPLEDYYALVNGYENGDAAAIETSRKALLARVKSFAKDVVTKYVSPPDTTSFAILFLPTEGLYAEIVRDAAFFDGLRRDGVVVAGPTTLSATLNSLQVGFKTLQIQKNAADIEKTLGSVKKEFETFETVLKKAHDRITQAGNEIETLVGVRTRAINRSLREVQLYDTEAALPESAGSGAE